MNWKAAVFKSRSVGRPLGTTRVGLRRNYSTGICIGDGQLLSCYIFDIDTANLDNQHLVMPYDHLLPLNQLFRDSIARHFLGWIFGIAARRNGSRLHTEADSGSDLAADEPAAKRVASKSVSSGAVVRRNPVDEKSCYVIRCLSQGMTSDVWIDVEIVDNCSDVVASQVIGWRSRHVAGDYGCCPAGPFSGCGAQRRN